MNDSTLPMPLRALRQLTCTALGKALNRALALDPEAQARLAPLEDNRVALHLRGVGLTLYITVLDGKLSVDGGDESAIAPALQLATTPAGIIDILLHRHRDEFPAGAVQVTGDVALARQLQKLVADYAPDIEAAFTSAFGSVLGPRFAHAAQQAFSSVRSGVHSLREVAGHRQERADRTAATEAAVHTVNANVDALEDRVKRLEKLVTPPDTPESDQR